MELRADCSRCVGLCCVAPAFARSADFAIDKPAGTPCGNLQADFRCAIHTDLRDRGFAGCTVFDCLGAGQRVTAAFVGRDWRTPDVAAPMFAAFAAARQVHELLWYLDEARVRAPEPALDAEWTHLLGDVAGLDVAAAHERVGELLRQASERLRTPAAAAAPEAEPPTEPPTDGESPVSTRRVVVPDTVSRATRHGESGFSARRAARGGRRPGAMERPTDSRSTEGRPRDHSRADLVGVRWRNADLRRASLRGALLLGADLRGADLRLADLLGADLRGADLRGADLSTSLFVTPMQAASAKGDAASRLPDRVPRPAHWTA